MRARSDFESLDDVSKSFVWPHIYVICLRKAYETDGRKTLDKITRSGYPGTATLVPATTPDDIPVIHDLVHPFAQLTVFGPKRRALHEQLNHPNQVACYISHMKLWEKCAQLGVPLLVMEQDAHWSPIDTELRELPRAAVDADMVTMVSYKSSSAAHPDPVTGVLRVEYFVGGGAYYITPQAARKLLKYALPVTMHQDTYVSTLVQLGSIRMHATPNFASQRLATSDLQHSTPVIQELDDRIRKATNTRPTIMAGNPCKSPLILVVITTVVAAVVCFCIGWAAWRFASRRRLRAPAAS